MSDLSEMNEDQLWELAGTQLKSERAEALFELGTRFAAVSNWNRAEGLFLEAQTLAFAVGESLLGGRTAYSLGLTYSHLENYDSAADQFQIAADTYQMEGRFAWQGDAIYQLAIALAELDNTEMALLNYQFAADLYDSEELGFHVAKSVSAKGELLGYLGRQSQALEAFQLAREKYAEVNDGFNAAKMLDRIGAALMDLDRVREATEAFQQAKDTMEYLEAGADVTYAKHRLGEGLKTLGEYEKAIEILTESAAEYKAAGEHVRAAQSDLYRGQCFVELERFEEAESLFIKLEAYLRSVDSIRMLGMLEISRATIAKKVENWDLAHEHYEKAFAIARKADDDWLEMASRICIAESFVRREDWESAQETLKWVSVEGIGEQQHFSNRIKVVNASCQLGRGNSLEAEQTLLEVLCAGDGEVIAEIRGNASLLLARIREAEGRTEDAEQLRAKGNALVDGAAGA